MVGRDQALLHQPHEGAHDVVEGHVVGDLLGENLVDYRDGADPPHRLVDGLAGLVGDDAAPLQPQEGGNRLEVVLDPVVDLGDRRVLRNQQAVAAAQLGDVAHQGEGSCELAALDDGHASQHDGLVVELDLL